MFGILEAVSVPHSGIFETYEDLMRELNDRMGKDGYKIVKARSHRGRMGGADVPNNEIVRCDLVCDRGGRPYKCMATKHKTTTKKTGCPWRAKAVNRKTLGGWVLTIACDQHNHEAGTPEPPTPSEGSAEEDNAEDVEDDGPPPDAETAAALNVAGVSDAVLRLNGETFHQLKRLYRKMNQADRLEQMAQMQLKMAAIYAVQNEDMHRQRRQLAQDKRHKDVDAGRQQPSSQKKSRKRRQSGEAEVSQEAPPQMTPQQMTPQQMTPQQPEQHQQLAMSAEASQHVMMQQPHFQLNHHPVQQTPVPIPDMSIPRFQHYPGPPKRMRGPRPSQGSQPAT